MDDAIDFLRQVIESDGAAQAADHAVDVSWLRKMCCISH
jgi:hypothetical protein